MTAANRKAMIVPDTANNPTFKPNPLLPETRSELAMPLMVGDRVVGVLDLQSQHTGTLSSENLPVFQTLAGQLAIALDNAGMFAQTEQARREVEMQSRRQTQIGWQDFLSGLEHSQRIGYVYEQNKLMPFNTPLPQAQTENTVKSQILVTGTPVGSIQLERAENEPWQTDETELVSAVLDQASRQLDNLRLLAQAESYRNEAEEAARRLTREGWTEYLQNKTERSGYIYDRNRVLPLDQSAAAGTNQTAGAVQAVKTVVQPLKVGSEIVGELAFDGIEELDQATHEMVNSMADVLSSHIEELRLTEQTQKALIQTENLYSSSAQVVRSSSIDEVLKSVIETTSLRRFDRGSITFFDQTWVDEKHLKLASSLAYGNARAETYPRLLGRSARYATRPLRKFFAGTNP